jgi:hypothetical protein
VREKTTLSAKNANTVTIRHNPDRMQHNAADSIKVQQITAEWSTAQQDAAQRSR